MSAFPKYPSIVLLDKRPELFAVKEVIATEKLHGSNFRIHFPMGMTSVEEVRFGSHEVDYEPGKPFPLGSSVAWWKARPDKLQRMWEVILAEFQRVMTAHGGSEDYYVRAAARVKAEIKALMNSQFGVVRADEGP